VSRLLAGSSHTSDVIACWFVSILRIFFLSGGDACASFRTHGAALWFAVGVPLLFSEEQFAYLHELVNLFVDCGDQVGIVDRM